MSFRAENPTTGRSYIPPTDAEIRFLKMIKNKGQITIGDALDFENQPGEPGFGPGLDALDILDKNIDLGIIEFSEKDSKYTYKGLNAPDTKSIRFGPEPGWDF